MSQQPRAIFINTRPEHRAWALDTLDGSALSVLSLPLLHIQDRAIGDDETRYMADYLQGGYDLVVVTSAEAARCALAYLSQSDKQTAGAPPSLTHHNTPIIAVGRATAEPLAALGYEVMLPDTANNEGMLQMPVIDRLTASAKVLIWRGVGGRRLLVERLQARGVHIDAVAWYERVMPPALPQSYQAIADELWHAVDKGVPVYVLVSSQAALMHWQVISGELARQVRYVALGQRLADIAAALSPMVYSIDELSAQAVLAVCGEDIDCF